MKRIAAFLVALMLCLMISPATSASTTQDVELFDILTREEFISLFVSDLNLMDDEYASLSEMIEVSYSYDFEILADNPTKANVFLTFDMQVGTAIYPFYLQGTVDQYRLSWGEVLWEGPVYGNIAINGTECFVSSSFSKIDGKAGAQVSVTIRPRLTESNFSPVSFVFGNEILTIDMIEDLKRSNTDSTGLSSNMGEFCGVSNRR